MDKSLKTHDLISFEFNRRPGDGEKFKIFYCKQLDKFFQLQESSNISNNPSKSAPCSCSMLVGSSVFRSTSIYLMTEFDPMFFMVPIFQLLKNSYQNLSQILEQALTDYEGSCVPSSTKVEDKEGNSYELKGSICKSSLVTTLMASKRLQRSLDKICDIKEDTYRFNIEKFMLVLVKKTMEIYSALQKRLGEQKEINKNIMTLAASFIVDELPQDLVQTFLERVDVVKTEFKSKNSYLEEKENNPRQSMLAFG
jgi:hypothetical protein